MGNNRLNDERWKSITFVEQMADIATLIWLDKYFGSFALVLRKQATS